MTQWETLRTQSDRTIHWHKIICKGGSGLLVYANNLVVSGGYGVLPELPDPDKYVPDPARDGNGWTNEVHCFHVDSSELC